MVSSAKAADLVYVPGNKPGFSRTCHGKIFFIMMAIKKLKIKHNWGALKNWAYPLPGKCMDMQACQRPSAGRGFDLLHRKRYRYHPLWNAVRKHTKFYRLQEFGK